MKMTRGSVVASFVLLSVMSAGAIFAQSQTATKSKISPPTASPAVAAPKATATVDTAQLKATASKVAASFNESPKETIALLNFTKSQDVSSAKGLLIKHGFTAQQLEGARIVLKDATKGQTGGQGGAASKIKVTIEASCCPATITVTISW
jgi:hypothetical protein